MLFLQRKIVQVKVDGLGNGVLKFQNKGAKEGKSLYLPGQLGLKSEFQNSQNYAEKLCLE